MKVLIGFVTDIVIRAENLPLIRKILLFLPPGMRVYGKQQERYHQDSAHDTHDDLLVFLCHTEHTTKTVLNQNQIPNPMQPFSFCPYSFSPVLALINAFSLLS